MSGELQTIENGNEIVAMHRRPNEVLSEAKEAATALMEYVEAGKAYLAIGKRKHLYVEAWQLLGRFYGLSAKVTSTKEVNIDGAEGFEATASVFHSASGNEISSASALCLRDEEKWNTRPKYKWVNNNRVQDGEEKVPSYQLKSMAQTRACSKAFRNCLSWIVMMAGYSPTPAEEMTGNEHDGQIDSSGIEKRIKSKYDNAKCGFCGEKHIKKGEDVVLVGGKWGSESCLKKEEEPPTVDKETGEVKPDPDAGDKETLAEWISQFALTYPEITEKVTGQKDNRYSDKTFLMTFGLRWMKAKQALLQKALDESQNTKPKADDDFF